MGWGHHGPLIDAPEKCLLIHPPWFSRLHLTLSKTLSNVTQTGPAREAGDIITPVSGVRGVKKQGARDVRRGLWLGEGRGWDGGVPGDTINNTYCISDASLSEAHNNSVRRES